MCRSRCRSDARTDPWRRSALWSTTSLSLIARLLGATGRVDIVGQAGDAEALARACPPTGVPRHPHAGPSGLELVERLPRGLWRGDRPPDQYARAFEANRRLSPLPIEPRRMDRALDRAERLRADPCG
jgi:hypothetical protein